MRARVEPQLHQDQVEPAPELETDLGHARDLDEAEPLVEADRGVVLAVDGVDEDVQAGVARALDESFKERPATPPRQCPWSTWIVCSTVRE